MTVIFVDVISLDDYRVEAESGGRVDLHLPGIITCTPERYYGARGR